MEIRQTSPIDPSAYRVQRSEEYYQRQSAMEQRPTNIDDVERRLKQEELTSRQTTRAATYDEILAFLEAEVLGLNEIQKESRPTAEGEVGELRMMLDTEKMNSLDKTCLGQQIESRTNYDGSRLVPEMRPKQYIDQQNIYRDSVCKEDMSTLSSYGTPPYFDKEFSPSGLRIEDQPHVRAGVVVDSGVNAPTMNYKQSSSKSTLLDKEEINERSGLLHEIRHKRQTLEEVVLYDVHKFYEEQEKSANTRNTRTSSEDRAGPVPKKTRLAESVAHPDQEGLYQSENVPTRKRAEITVTYVVRSDEARRHKKLSKKDWSKFKANVTPGNVSAGIVGNRPSEIIISSRPTAGVESSQQRYQALPLTQEYSPRFELTEARRDFSINPSYSAHSSATRPSYQQGMAVATNYTATYSEPNFSSNLKTKMEQQKNETDAIGEYPYRNDDTLPLANRSRAQHVVNPDERGQNFDLPDFYVYTNSQASTNSTLEGRSSLNQQPMSDIVYPTTSSPEVNPATVQYVVCYNKEAEASKMELGDKPSTLGTGNLDYNLPGVEVYGKVKHPSQDDIHFTVDYPQLPIQTHPIPEKSPTIRVPIPDIMDLRLDPTPPRLLSHNEKVVAKEPQYTVTINRPAYEEPQYTVTLNKPAFERSPPPPPPQITPKSLRKIPVSVKYVVNYDEPFISKPKGKYRRPVGVKATKVLKAGRPKFFMKSKSRSTDVKNVELPAVTYVVQYSDPPWTKQPKDSMFLFLGSKARTNNTGLSPIAPTASGAPSASAEQKTDANVNKAAVRKARRSPMIVTYVVNYDRPFRRSRSDSDSYTGRKIKNWYLKRKSVEIALPETAPPRAEIRANEIPGINILVESPETRKIRFKPTVQFKDDVDYELNLKAGSPAGSLQLTRPQEQPISSSARVDLAQVNQESAMQHPKKEPLILIQKPNFFESLKPSAKVSVDESVQLNSPSVTVTPRTVSYVAEQSQTVAEEKQKRAEVKPATDLTQNIAFKIPKLNLKRKIPNFQAQPQSSISELQQITYVVTNELPTGVQESGWPRKKQSECNTKTPKAPVAMHVESQGPEFPESIAVKSNKNRISHHVKAGLNAEGYFVMQERTPEAAVVIPESSSLEFPVNIPTALPSSKQALYTVTYKVGYEIPARKKEWDIKVKSGSFSQSAPKGKENIRTDSTGTKPAGVKSRRSPPKAAKPLGSSHTGSVHSVTYSVSHDVPKRRKEWDITGKRKARPGAASYSSSAAADYILEAPEVKGLQLTPGSSSVRVPKQTSGARQIANREPMQEIGYNFAVDVPPGQANFNTPYQRELDGPEFKELQLKLSSSSLRMPAKITYSVDHDWTNRVNDWNVNVGPLQTSANFVQSNDNVPVPRQQRAENVMLSNSASPQRIAFGQDYRLDNKAKNRNVAASSIAPVMTATNVVPVKSQPEFTSQKADNFLPQTMTYQVNYDRPKQRKEWDFKIKRPKNKLSGNRKVKPIKPAEQHVSWQNDSDLNQRIEPETLTYRVNYDLVPPPRPVVANQPASNFNMQSEGSWRTNDTELRYEIDEARFVQQSPVVSKLQLVSDSSSVRLPKGPVRTLERQDITFKGPQITDSPRSFQDSAHVNIPTNKPAPYTVTYRITYEQPQPRKEWDIKTRKNRANLQTRGKGDERINTSVDKFVEEPRVGPASIKVERQPLHVSYKADYEVTGKPTAWDNTFRNPETASLRVKENKDDARMIELDARKYYVEKTKPKKLPVTVCYEVNYDQPQKFKQWDITVKKPVSARQVKGSTNIKVVAYPAEEKYNISAIKPEFKTMPPTEEKMQVKKSIKILPHKASYDVSIPTIITHEPDDTDVRLVSYRSQAQAHLPQIEQPPNMIAPQVKAKQDAQVIFEVTSEPLHRYREWDIKLKKTQITPSGKAKQEIEVTTHSMKPLLETKSFSTPAQKRNVALPQTCVYEVNYDPIHKFKNWDIKLTKGGPKPPKGSTDIKEAVYPVSSDVNVTSAKLKEPKVATYQVIHEMPVKYNEWDITVTRPSGILTRGKSEQKSLKAEKVVDHPKTTVTIEPPKQKLAADVKTETFTADVSMPPLVIPIDAPKKSRGSKQGVTVTYEVSHGTPAKWKEWDLRLNKAQQQKVIKDIVPMEKEEQLVTQTHIKSPEVDTSIRPFANFNDSVESQLSDFVDAADKLSVEVDVFETPSEFPKKPSIEKYGNYQFDSQALSEIQLRSGGTADWNIEQDLTVSAPDVHVEENLPYLETDIDESWGSARKQATHHDDVQVAATISSETAHIDVQKEMPILPKLKLSPGKQETALHEGIPEISRNRKRASHSITYIITNDRPETRKEWDIKVKKPKKLAAVVTKPDYSSKTTSKDYTAVVPCVLDQPKIVTKTPHKSRFSQAVTYMVNYDIPKTKKEWDIDLKKSFAHPGKRIPEKDLMVAEPEAKPIAVSADVQKIGTVVLPQSVTYTINYQPEPRKEWDIRGRKARPKSAVHVQRHAELDLQIASSPTIIREATADGRALPQAVTCTYKVNYEMPETRKEWDIGTGKARAKSADKATHKEVAVPEHRDKAATDHVPESIAFVVKYELPVSEKKGKQIPDKDGDWTFKLPKPENVPPELVVAADENTGPSELANLTPSVSPTKAQTMTFIVNYDMPLDSAMQKRISKSRLKNYEDKTIADTYKPSDTKASTEKKGRPTVEVQIPALTVSKVSKKISQDKKSETITYVVNYELPSLVNKSKKPPLIVGEPTVQPLEKSNLASHAGDDVDVTKMLEGPETYFHIHQPSPEILCIDAPGLLGKEAPSKQREPQQAIYTVTYEVITKKKPSKKNKTKKDLTEKMGLSKTAKVPEIVVPSVEITVQDFSDISANVANPDVSANLNPELAIYVIDDNDVINVLENDDQSANLEGNIVLTSPEISVVVEPQKEISDYDTKELEQALDTMFEDATKNANVLDVLPEVDISYSVTAEAPTLEMNDTFKEPTIREESLQIDVVEPCDTVNYPAIKRKGDEYGLAVAVAATSPDFTIPYMVSRETDIKVHIEPVDLSPDLKMNETLSFNEVVTSPELPVVEVKPSAEKPKISAEQPKLSREPQSVTYIVQHEKLTTKDRSKVRSGVSVDEEKLDTSSLQKKTIPNASISAELEVSSSVNICEPDRPDDGTVEVLKVLVPLMQTGAIQPSPISIKPPSQVTYVVHHDDVTPAAEKQLSTPQTSKPSATPRTKPVDQDRLSGCFGKQSKPIKFEERLTKTTVKPTLAVSPSIRPKTLERQECVLVPIPRLDLYPVSVTDVDRPCKTPESHFVVVAIDVGTTFSGYAFRFARDLDARIHMMRQWEGGDPGAVDFKTPTTLLLSPDGQFHSFGFTARDFFHDLNPSDAKRWMYFEKFKMALHTNPDLNLETEITASNGERRPALVIFSHALRFFKEHALQEITEQSSIKLVDEDIQWILTVPAIWKSPAKQFMRCAAYQAGIVSPDNPEQLLISLEPEAASISVRQEKFQELVPETRPVVTRLRTRRSVSPTGGRWSVTPGGGRRSATPGRSSVTPDRGRHHSEPRNVGELRPDVDQLGQLSINWSDRLPPTTGYSSELYLDKTVGEEVNVEGTRYIVMDCGGGTVDITVHEIESNNGRLKEVYKASGGTYGSIGVDKEFEQLLENIFGTDFINVFKLKRPAGWVDLMMAFESRKRAADPLRRKALNVSLPFSFIDYHKKIKNFSVETAVSKYADKNVSWSRQGMLRLLPEAMDHLFQPTLTSICSAVKDVLNQSTVSGVKFLFLVGGFAESAMLQAVVRSQFGHLVKILIPYDVSLTILKGAVSYGCDPSVVTIRKSRLTYGVAVQTRFIRGQHPRSKLVTREGEEWCSDVFDALVLTDQSVALGDAIVRHYSVLGPLSASSKAAAQQSYTITIYSSESPKVQFTTDSGVKKCGTLFLDLEPPVAGEVVDAPEKREVQLRMSFGNTEITVTAKDSVTGKCIRAAIDFMNQ